LEDNILNDEELISKYPSAFLKFVYGADSKSPPKPGGSSVRSKWRPGFLTMPGGGMSMGLSLSLGSPLPGGAGLRLLNYKSKMYLTIDGLVGQESGRI